MYNEMKAEIAKKRDALQKTMERAALRLSDHHYRRIERKITEILSCSLISYRQINPV